MRPFRAWLRQHQRSVINTVVFVVISGIVLSLVFAKSPLRGELSALGMVGSILAGTIGSVIANLLQAGRTQPPPRPDAQMPARERYLTGLRTACQALPLATLGGKDGIDQGPTLDDVYIALNTTTAVPVSETEPAPPREARRAGPDHAADTRRLTALEAVKRTPRLVLLGDPGAGKSTFVRRVLANLATENLSAGTIRARASGVLLPVLITLRDLVPRLARLALKDMPAQERRRCLAEAVRDQALDDLQRWEAADFAAELREDLTTGRCLLVLDGMDEVPYDLRASVRDTVAAVIGTYPAHQVIVTCRIQSYVKHAILENFQTYTLAAFDDDQVRNFVHCWYRAQRRLGRVDARQEEDKASDLAREVLGDALQELARNPMLLTTMAIIHQQETRLPRKRVRLYKQAVELLLWRWERERASDAGLRVHLGLATALPTPERLREVVEGLAYTAHCCQQEDHAGGDLRRGDALVFLEHANYLGNAGAASAFLDYVDQRAGLLVGQGGAPEEPPTYRFPHRTFQEYLAGCYLIRQRERGRVCCEHASRGEVWSLAVQLGAEEMLYNRRMTNELYDLAYYLCPAAASASTQARRAVLWSGNMVVLAGQEAIVRDTGGLGGGAAYLQRLRTQLVQLLRSDLTAPERAAAGVALAHLDDPRFRANAWYLPDEPLLGFTAAAPRRRQEP